MLYLRSFNRFILIFLALLGLSVSSASAATVNYVDAQALDFRIASITNLDIGGSPHDVTYHYGLSWNDTGLGLYFATNAEATAASNAVRDVINPLNINPPYVSIAYALIIPYALSLGALDAVGTYRCGSSPNRYCTGDPGPIPAGEPFPASAAYGDFSPVSAVPVPAAVWLFGTALVGLVGFSKRKSRIAA